MASSWLDFWNGSHRIYVNARHAQVHYAKIAADFIALIPSTDAIVVDWGCGEASQALTVAAHCRCLVLCDAASATRGRLAGRFAASTEPDAAKISRLLARGSAHALCRFDRSLRRQFRLAVSVSCGTRPVARGRPSADQRRVARLSSPTSSRGMTTLSAMSVICSRQHGRKAFSSPRSADWPRRSSPAIARSVTLLVSPATTKPNSFPCCTPPASPRPAFSRTWASTSGEWHSARRLGEMRRVRRAPCKRPGWSSAHISRDHCEYIARIFLGRSKRRTIAFGSSEGDWGHVGRDASPDIPPSGRLR